MGKTERDEQAIERFYARDRELQEAGLTTKAIAAGIGYTTTAGLYMVRSKKSRPTARRIYLMDRLYHSVIPSMKTAHENASNGTGETATKGMVTASYDTSATVAEKIRTAKWAMQQAMELLNEVTESR